MTALGIGNYLLIQTFKKTPFGLNILASNSLDVLGARIFYKISQHHSCRSLGYRTPPEAVFLCLE